MLFAHFYLAVMTLVGPGHGPCKDVPPILLDAHHRRDDFKTARLRYVVDCEFPGVQAPGRKRYEARISGDDIAWTDFGDDDGIVMHNPQSGEALLGVFGACAYRQTIRHRKSGVEWTRMEGESGLARGEVDGGNPMLTDPRSVGLSVFDPREKSPAILRERLTSNADLWTWGVKSEGELKVVTKRSAAISETDKRHYELVWKIDPDRDSAIVRIEQAVVEPGGQRELLAWADTDYQFVDGRWWPGHYETYIPKTGYRMKVTFQLAEFDRPEHPSELTPDIWNVPSGAHVLSRFDPQTGESEQRTVRYMGDGLTITNEDWSSIDTEPYYPQLTAYWDSQRSIGSNRFPDWWGRDTEDFGLAGASIHPDLWEAYVRRWITRHADVHTSNGSLTKSKLDPEQIAAAWAILADCRRHADPTLQRMAEVTSGVEKAGAAPGIVPIDVKASKSAGQPAPTEADLARTQARSTDGDSDSASARTVVRRVDVAPTGGADDPAPKISSGDASPLARSSEPSWEQSTGKSRSAEPALPLTQDQRDLVRIFGELKRRLVMVLRREQMLPKDSPAAGNPRHGERALGDAGTSSGR